ncbi:hypothetical protein CBR_g54423 [Chara braunii]|uniref:Reverse transcriptase n=1 Tax=Chara braunii TaxID=69332 RepID=A0A388MC87_CHABU|nr:hypothetical protein CBR_g54423 [Chara braunii]|eukprot:GBG92123.1 hypothetical protein CBR_g54423 [Chara braunii]
MASQPAMLTPEDVAIQQAALQEAQLQQALGQIKREKEMTIRRRTGMERRGADIEELEAMDLMNMDDDVRVVRRALLGGPGQSQWVPKTIIAAPKPFTGDKRGEDLDTWLRAVPVYVRCKLILPHEEVLVAESYLEGSAARWLSGLVQLQGHGHDFRSWAASQKLEDFLKMVEERWHDPQEAQKATDAILTLHMRQYKSVREATDVVERLICVPGVHYDPQVLLTSYLRCLSQPLRNHLAKEANINMHNFPSFSKVALDLEAKTGHGHNSVTDGKKKTLPPNWKAKGRIMFVDHDGSTIELDDDSQIGLGAEAGGDTSEGGVVAAVTQQKECLFPFAGGELRHRVSFLVSNDLPMDILLGMYYLSVAQPQFDWDRKVVKHTLPGGGTARLHKFKASSLIDSHGCMCAAASYNYYKQHQEEGMYLVYVSAAGDLVKMLPEIEGVVAKYPDLFEEPTGVVDREVVHAIEIIPGSSIPRGRIHRMSPGELDELRRQLKELVEKGWIRPSVSPSGSPVLFVPQKKEGTLRMCIDYRGLNAITVKNREPLPRIDDLLDRVQGCRNFSKIDLKSGYHQIAIRPEDQHKTAFQTRYDLYEFVVMPFGLCNAPGTFQHAMNRIFHDYLDKFVIAYLDDILIFSKTVEEHVAHVDKVLSLLRQHKFKINGEKCEFGRTRVLYLGHEISAEGLKPDDAKVASIRDWPRPQSVTEMRSFLGMTGYYRTFVKNYSVVAAPLTDLTRLDTPWEWTEECKAAFRHLKHALTHYEVLKLPDPDKPFIVTTDASQYGIGAVLAQQEGPKLRPIEYMSKKMPSQKFAKSTYEKELYAVFKALTHWRHYLLGRFFILRTDHQTLRWMRTQPVLSDALKRWIEVIEQYDFDPQYIKGEYNKVVDALSRRPDFSGVLITEYDLTDNVTRSLVEAYREDQFMAEIIRRLEAKDKQTSAKFELVNGLLFLEKEGNKCLCVPNKESLRSLFLGECHDSTGHFGYKKTAANLLQRFWWPTMLKDAKLYVETCQVCQRDKPRTQAPLGLLKPLPILERPGESLSMDFMDTLVTSKSGMRQIFVIVDRFSKYARLIAMPETAKTEYVIRLIKENWVRDSGLPKSIVSDRESIVSDRDVRFTSELWKAAAAEQGTQLQMTSRNHPEANDQAEQMNRAVQQLLRHYIKPNQVDRDEKLSLVASLYNNAVHSSTNSLHLTFRPRLPLDFLLPDNQPTVTPGTLEFAYRYEQKMHKAVEHMQKAQGAMIESENKHRRPSTFQVGNRVWVKSSELGQEFGISRKLMPQYFGPWEILNVVGTDPDGPSYVIRIPGHLRTYPVFHASKLAASKETNQFPSRRSMLPPTMDGEVNIDDIVDHREMPIQKPPGRECPPKPKLQFRVHFRHHTDPKEDRWFTWEELMQTAPQIVARYEKDVLKGKRQMAQD